jgi:hypothetical protein
MHFGDSVQCDRWKSVILATPKKTSDHDTVCMLLGAHLGRLEHKHVYFIVTFEELDI